MGYGLKIYVRRWIKLKKYYDQVKYKIGINKKFMRDMKKWKNNYQNFNRNGINLMLKKEVLVFLIIVVLEAKVKEEIHYFHQKHS